MQGSKKRVSESCRVTDARDVPLSLHYAFDDLGTHVLWERATMGHYAGIPKTIETYMFPYRTPFYNVHSSISKLRIEVQCIT